MIICIPSYKRAGKLTTLQFLDGAFLKEEIIIGTQTPEDYNEYQAFYGSCATVIYKEAHSVSENRNSLLEHCHARGIAECLMLDDDIKYIMTMHKAKLKGESFKKLMQSCFDVCRKNDIVMFGGYCCSNPFMMTPTAKPNIIVGMLCGILDTSMRYDTTFRIKEDYELSLRLMAQGKKVIRFNSFGAEAKHKTSGGCSDDWKAPDYQKWADILVDAYPTLVKHNNKRKGEILFIGK